MKSSMVSFVVVCGVFIGFAGSVQASLPLYASTVWGALYDLDSHTGLAMAPRDTGTVHLVDIQADTDGTLYGLTSWGGSPANSLLRINPTTGAATLIGWTGLYNIFEGDLALDPLTGQLYGVNEYSGGTPELFRINKNTGEATVVGSIPHFGDFSAMSFDRDGNLFTLDTHNRQLLTLDKNTAGILAQVPVTGFQGSVTAGMDVDPITGLMCVVSGDVPTSLFYTLNTYSGILTTWASTNVSGWAGLTFMPEPSSLLLLAPAVFFRRRR